MSGYQNEHGQLMPIEGEYYKTGDVASRDADGYITFIGRADDVFKSSDYRLSPFELESVLIEHPAIAEAAVVPAPDPMRYTIAKGYVALAQGHAPDRETAAAIFKHMRGRLSSYKLVRRIEFFELPKTVSGKIRRVELRQRESALAERGERAEAEFRIEDFPEDVTKTAPPGRSGAAKLKEREGWTYIAVSEPWPFGVVMPSQVPLATYFQWPGS